MERLYKNEKDEKLKNPLPPQPLPIKQPSFSITNHMLVSKTGHYIQIPVQQGAWVTLSLHLRSSHYYRILFNRIPDS